MKKKVCLVILDGWGIGRNDSSNAIYMAKTDFADWLNKNAPHAELRTDGTNVGLPEGQMGNSEVGHMNIGAGRVVYQDLVKINLAIQDGSFFSNPALVQAFEKAATEQKKLHLIGLVSDGGVHSHINHLLALVRMASKYNVPQCLIHAFTDGRDTDPKSGAAFIKEVEDFCQGTPARIATLVGRYFAMDRDKRWDRISKAWNLMVNGVGKGFDTASEALKEAYANGTTDEFIEPCVIGRQEHSSSGKIEDGDVVICFNFRTDRCREITMALTQQEFPESGMKPLALDYYTMTNYDDSFKGVQPIFDKDNLNDTLGEAIAKSGGKQYRIAETEKYPHVTFFFSGGREEIFLGEKRSMVASPKVATYDLQPEMSAQGVADATMDAMKNDHPDFIVVNFANPDMVGHTGVFSAIVKAVETTDRCLKQVVETGQSEGYSFVIIADHGNADCAVNDDGSPNTAHTTNPVPIWLLDRDYKSIENGKLSDIAPTILQLLEINQPSAMTGKSLVS